MRLLIFIVLLSAAAWPAAVDTDLYEGTNREAYYQQVQKEIETAAQNSQVSKEIVQEERLYLERVRSASSQAPQIERYDLQRFSGSAITPENYYGGIDAAATLRLKLQQREMLPEIDAKLGSLKQTIEHLTEGEKPRLLSYQLQFAYYKLQQKNLEAKLVLLQNHEQEIMGLLVSKLSLLQCDVLKTIEQGVLRSDKEIERNFQQKAALQIDLKKAVIEESAKTGQIQQKINDTEALNQDALRQKIAFEVQQALCMLKQKESRDFFILLGEMQAVITEISGEEQPRYRQQLNILREIAREVFGSAKLFLGATQYESNAILTNLKDFFSAPLFAFNEQPISLLSLLKALILVTLGIIAGRFYKRWIARAGKRWPDMSQMSIRLASNIGYYLIIIVTLIIALGSIGIDMSSISLIAGALSIGIGFGLQTVVSNFIAGIILMFERTIRIGDTIELSDTLRGRVTDMRIRSTTIKTFDNIDIVVPNSSFIQNNVVNWTLEDLSRRLHIPFGVAYGTKVEDVKQAVLEELAQSRLTYIKDDETKQPEVWMVAMNSSSVDFELLVWVEWLNALRPNALRSDFMILIYNALYKHGIQIPFPQLDLYVKQMPSETLK
ncbi:mechanosensitive ion channel [bacterium]|nr:mechanosensitive ion channel [bacterium]